MTKGMINEPDGKDLLYSLHEQFSINQNDASTRFITFFVGIIAVFGFYGYVYGAATGIVSYNPLKINIAAVFMMAIVVEVILSFLLCLIIYNGYQHRRDQLMNTKIRYYFMHDDNLFNSFFENYKGDGKKITDYIPGYQQIFGYFLFAFKMLLLISIVSLPLFSLANNCDSINRPKIFINNINNNTVSPKTYKKVNKSQKTSQDTVYVIVDQRITNPSLKTNAGKSCRASKINSCSDVSHTNCSLSNQCTPYMFMNCCLWWLTLLIMIGGFVLVISFLVRLYSKYKCLEKEMNKKIEDLKNKNDCETSTENNKPKE